MIDGAEIVDRESFPSLEHTQTRAVIQPEVTRQNLVEDYNSHLEILSNSIEQNRQKKEIDRREPLITVVVSLREEDDDLLTSKMFEHSLEELLRQAKAANINLDLIVVSNNGGGTTEELGNKMRSRPKESLEKYFGQESVNFQSTLC